MTETSKVFVKDNNRDESTSKADATSVKKAKISKRRGIFLSYCNSGDFFETKFMLDLATHLQENGFYKDLWFDFSQLPADAFDIPLGYAVRFEAVEKCKTVIIVLSKAYTQCRWCLATLRTLLLRKKKQPAFRIFIIIYSSFPSHEAFNDLLDDKSTCYVDLSVEKHNRLSTSEKVVVVLRAFMEYLEIYSSGESSQASGEEVELSTVDLNSKLLKCWSTIDVINWLRHLGVHEKSIMNFEEMEVNGKLLPYLTDSVLHDLFAIESKVSQRRIRNSIERFQIKEQEKNNWAKFTQQRGKPLSVYLIFDPSDKSLAQLIATDLKKKGLKVLSHTKLGQTREEFLLLNGSDIAKAETSIVILTKAASASPFVYNEVIMSMWLDRRIISLLFQSSLDTMKISLRGILSSHSAINFNALYADALEILAHELRGRRSRKGVIYEQAFLRLLSSSIRPLEELLQSDISTDVFKPRKQEYVFFSYHWDNQSQVRRLSSYLAEHGISCFSDMDFVTNSLNSPAQDSPARSAQIDGKKPLDSAIEHAIRNASMVVLCVSRKYFQCYNRIEEIFLAQEASKPMIPVMMEWIHWPPVNLSVDLRRMLVVLDHYDLSTDRTLKRNFPFLVARLKNAMSVQVNDKT